MAASKNYIDKKVENKECFDCSSVPSSIKKRTRTRNTDGHGALKLTTKTPVESDMESLAGPSCNDDLQYGEHSGVATPNSSSAISNSLPSQVEESDEARKKFPNAKSISSAQFFGRDGDHVESTATLADIVKNKLWRFGKKLDDLMETPEHDHVDVSGLRSEVAMLALNLRSIPYETSREMIDSLETRTRVALAIHQNPKNRKPLLGARADVIKLHEELIFGRMVPDHPHFSDYNCLINKDKY